MSMNTYIDQFTFLRATTGLETASLVGNSARLSGTHGLGAIALTPAPATTVDLHKYDRITIFDGSATEVVTVTTDALAPSAVIPISATAFAHADGTPWCSDGAQGSLADSIVDASAWLERMCYQSLLQATYTNEAIDMPSMRAAVSNRGALTFRPWHWPVTSVTALSIATADSTQVVNYNVTPLFIGGDKRLCSIRSLITIPPQSQTNVGSWSVPDRNADAQLLLTYQAGYAYNTLPGDLKEAVILVVSDTLAKRYNPMGAPDVRDGGSGFAAVLRGDMTGESIWIKRAMKTIEKYSAKLY